MDRVLIADKLAPEGMQVLEQAARLGQLQVDERTGLKPEELCAIVGDYDGLIVRSSTTTRSRGNAPAAAQAA